MVRETREKKVSVINMGWEEENRTTVLKTQADFQSPNLQQREGGREGEAIPQSSAPWICLMMFSSEKHWVKEVPV